MSDRVSDESPDRRSEPRDVPHRRSSVQPIEWLVVIHTASYAIAASWAFGGQADWVRRPLTTWGCVGFALMLAGILRQVLARKRGVLWLWILPVLLFNGLVLAATLNPNLREVRYGSDVLLAAVGARPAWPSSARPELARDALLQFDTMWLAGFNLVLVVRRRRLLRLLLLLLGANAVLLSIFGTVQKLLGAPGLFFGAVASPQSYFFASFVYHNHWGAYALLMLAVWLGLGRHFARRHGARDVFHSPATLAGVAVLVIAATIPLSGSRSCSLLMLILLGGTALQWAARIIRKRRHFNESIAPFIAVSLVVIALAVGAIGYLGRQMIARRFEVTIDQVEAARSDHFTDARRYVYRDTWRMFRDKPWFGWGMASFPYVFTTYNTMPTHPRFPAFFHDAHSDWLQALAEHGVVGTMLLITVALVPLLGMGRHLDGGLATYPLLGCALIVGYALLEFPFGNFAVVLTWWVCFFGAVQYARLTSDKFGSAVSEPARP